MYQKLNKSRYKQREGEGKGMGSWGSERGGEGSEMFAIKSEDETCNAMNISFVHYEISIEVKENI